MDCECLVVEAVAFFIEPVISQSGRDESEQRFCWSLTLSSVSFDAKYGRNVTRSAAALTTKRARYITM